MLFKHTSYNVGLFAEFIAKCFLILHGYRILNTRYITGKNTHRAEIDIISKYKNTIVFVEVKKRKNINLIFDAITNKQINRLRLAGETYLINKHWQGNARFDVIAIYGCKIKWFKNVF